MTSEKNKDKNDYTRDETERKSKIRQQCPCSKFVWLFLCLTMWVTKLRGVLFCRETIKYDIIQKDDN